MRKLTVYKITYPSPDLDDLVFHDISIRQMGNVPIARSSRLIVHVMQDQECNLNGGRARKLTSTLALHHCIFVL